MNLTTLNTYLFQMSDSEKKYQAGMPFRGWETLPRTMVHDRIVYELNPETDSSHIYAERNTSSNFQDNITIKRNSRFNPVPEHVHSYIELNYVYSGSCPQIINGNPILLKKNQILLIDTNCPHSIASLGKNDIMISLMIHRDFLRKHLFSQLSQDSTLSRFFVNAIAEKTDHEHYLLFHSENDRRIPMFFQELFCESYDPSINSNDILTHLFYIIMAQLINIHENDMAKENDFFSSVSLSPMIRYIEKNFLTCTQESVADFFHISPNYVSILLKKHIGMTYIQLIQEQKLTRAATLLKTTTHTVTEIANEVGYENISFFYKKFKIKFNCSPNDYR